MSSEGVDGLHVQGSTPADRRGGLIRALQQQQQQQKKSNAGVNLSLLGGRRLLEVPQFEGLVLGGRDQDRLHGVEGQVPDRVEVAPQGELGAPGLPQSVLVADLRKEAALTGAASRGRRGRAWKAVFKVASPPRSLTSYARLSASLATVSPASSPSPSSLETASSTRPRMKDFPADGRKLIGSSRQQADM